ncbi:MAG: cation:proton antiporter [Nanobdellota archaeon]
MDIFTDIGIIVIVATLGGFIARLLKQPLISSYIIMGIVIGPILGLITDMAIIDVLSEIGIAFLLFIVGIELDLSKLNDIGPIASLGTLLQMAASFVIGFGLFSLLGFTTMESVFAGIVLIFSSTMVVIKLLADKQQLDTLHGRIVIGSLLMQDVVAVVILSFLSTDGAFTIGSLGLSIFQAALVFFVAIVFSKFFFPRLFRFAAKSQELFFLLSLAVCFTFSLIFASIGFSIAIGAFVAGLMLGNLPYNIEIISKVKGLRDFFAILFFVSMGLKLSFGALTDFTLPFLILLFMTVIFTPFLTFVSVLAFGYNRRTAFLAAISLSQVSEFALIAVNQGIRQDYIGTGFLSLTILVALTSIIVTSYLIKFEDVLYRRLLPFLKRFDKLAVTTKVLGHREKEKAHNVVLVGYDRIGSTIYSTLKKLHKDVLIIDFNPDIIFHLMKDQVPCVYGDVGDDEVLDSLHLNKVKVVVSTIPSHHDTMLLIKKVRKVNSNAKIIVTAYIVEEALSLYEAGADYVILPHLLGGKHASVLLEDISLDIDKLITTKIAHIDELRRHHKNRRNPNHKHSRSTLAR